MRPWTRPLGRPTRIDRVMDWLLGPSGAYGLWLGLAIWVGCFIAVGLLCRHTDGICVDPGQAATSTGFAAAQQRQGGCL